MSNENEHSIDAAKQLAEYFEDAGATLQKNEDYEDEYLIDFAVTQLEHVHAHVNLGVHVTSSNDDLEDQQQFLKAAERGVVLKALYIEIDDVTVNSGGPLVAFGAALSFLFDQRYNQMEASGIRISEDCSFNFFDLEENIERLKRMSIDEDMSIGNEMEGRIIAYFPDNGYGFIQTEPQKKFFFHIANVVDDDLRGKLPSYQDGQIIPVKFQYGGYDDGKYPKAINVSIDSSREGEY